MEKLTALAVPVIAAAAAAAVFLRGGDVYGTLCGGIRGGLETVLTIFAPVTAILCAVGMMRASGLMDALTALFSPVTRFLGIPGELAPLMLIRPLSGSAALAVASELILKYGADSLVGRTAAVMVGATETTFYTAAVYFGAAKIKRGRYAIPAALTADAVGFVSAALFAKIFT